MVKAEIGYDSENDHLFILGEGKYKIKEGMPISENFTFLFDAACKIRQIEISFAYEFFKEFDPVNFKKNILKEVKKAEFDIKEYRDLILIEIIFIYNGKRIKEKLIFLQECIE